MWETLTRDYSIICNGTLWNILFVSFFIVALILSWLTTYIPPLEYRIWVSQIFSYNTYRLVQIHNRNRRNRRHIFWRSPLTINSTPQVSTIVIVQRPEFNLSYNRNIPSNFFAQNENDTFNTEQQRTQILNFITETIEAERPGDNQDDTNVTTENPSADWQALAEIVQQSSTNTNHQTSSTNNNSSNTMSATCTASTPKEEEDIIIKLKHPDDSIKLVKTKLSTSVSTFKTQNFGENASKTNLIFQGTNLADENRTLKSYGLFSECVVHYVTVAEGSPDNKEEATTTTIRLKYLDDRIVNAQFPSNATVSDFKKLHFAPELANGKVIRLIFQGQLLRNEGRTLVSYGIVEQSVVHVHIGKSAYRQEGATPQQPSTTQNVNDPAELFANPHLVVTGIAWLDSVLLTFLSSILFIVRWAEADDVLEENDPSFTARMHRWLRIIIRFLASIFMVVPQVNDTDMRHNFGAFFNFFLIVEIVLILSIALFFPQVVDFKTMFLISIISGFAFMFLWANRARPRAAA